MNVVLTKLKNDHKNTLVLLDLLSGQLEQLMNDGDPDWILMADIFDYVAQYPDNYHHPLEDALFKHFLFVYDHPQARQAIAKIVGEHIDIANKTLALQKILGSLQGENAIIRRDSLISDIDNYIVLQHTHLRYEETVIFPLIDSQMSKVDWETLGYSPDAVTDPVFEKPSKTHFSRLFNAITAAA